ncbi:MAG: WD40 repeat domain-containing protein [Spirochaetia bacterium]
MRLRLLLIVLACAGVAAYGEDFSAVQARFYSSAAQAIDVELSRFGTYTAIADRTEGNSVRVLDENWDLLWRHRQQVYWAATFKHPTILQFAPDESFLVYPAFRTENDIALVNPKTGDPISVLTDHTGTVDCLALSPDGTRMVSASSSEVFLWVRDGAGFKVVDKLAKNEASISSIAFSPDGALVAMSQYDDMARRMALYQVSGNRFVAAAKFENPENDLGHQYGQAVFSPDGQWLAVGYADTLKIFQRTGATFRLAQTTPPIELGSVDSVAFSPDSTLLLTGCYQDIRSWRLTAGTWKPESTFSPHHDLVYDMAFSIDGTMLAIAGRSDTNALGLWSVKGVGPSPSGALLSLLQGRVSAAQKRFLDDGLAKRIVSALAAADIVPRDMFETEAEYTARRTRAQAQAAALLQEETEKHFSAERTPLKGALYEVSVPLQAQGSYAIDTRTYTFRFMDTEATLTLERDPARELFRNWQQARVRAVRMDTADGTTYADFRLVLPVSALQFPLGLSENPFTGEKLDRYGAHVPSVSVGPDLLMRNLDIQGIFPALYRYYADHSLGQVTLQNTGSGTITGLSVRFFAPGFMKAPTDAPVPPELGVGQSVDVGIRAVLDSTVLDRSEGISVPAELTVQYTSGGKTSTGVVTRPIGILNRNALRWTDDKKVGAFMVINDPAFLRFSGQVMGMVDDTTTPVLTRNFLSAVRMFEALEAAELRYVVNPASPYESLSRDSTAIDFVRFPVETLDAKSGDCSDLSVLYDSLLESVGVDTAYITTPGHIFTAFKPGISPDTASRLFADPQSFIVQDDTVWIPVETTLVDQGFMKAWQTAAVEWQVGKAGKVAGFFSTKEAWQSYAPSGFVGTQSSAIPARDRVVELYTRELNAFRTAALGPREKEILDRLEKAPSPVDENRLGILYAQFGLLPKALEQFESAIAAKAYLPAMVNAANVYTIQQDYGRAQEYLKRAQQLEPDNARVLIALAFSLLQSGNATDAKSTFERAGKIDPALAFRYPLSGATSSNAAQGRAAGQGAPPELFSADWVQ